jgi:DNA-binding ferritin-like protein
MEDQMDLIREWYGDENCDAGLLTCLLGLLRALHWSHWNAHWQVKGRAFYGDHELFERLYTGMPGEIDGLAEKMVERYGDIPVDAKITMKTALLWITKWSEYEDLIERAYRAEDDLQDILEKLFDLLEESGALSLGMDDFLAALANAHETNMYLLKQRLGSEKVLKLAWTAPGDAKKYFFDNPEKREVSQLYYSKQPSNLRGEPGTPPTPTEILEKDPLAKEYSTLSRYVVRRAK